MIHLIKEEDASLQFCVFILNKGVALMNQYHSNAQQPEVHGVFFVYSFGRHHYVSLFYFD